MRELTSQNSEYKAQEIMKVFNGCGDANATATGAEYSVGGLLEGLGSLSNITTDTAEVARLRSQLSSKTNTILQLSEDKEVLEHSLEQLKQSYQDLKAREEQQS
jgi:hypothetical protein